MNIYIPLIIIGLSIIVSLIIVFNKMSNSNSTNTIPRNSSSEDNADSSVSIATPPTTSPTNWGKIVVGVVTVALLIGTLFLWAPWKEKTGNNNSLSLYWEPAIGPYGEQGIRIFVGDLAPTSICFDSLAYVRQKGETKDYPPTHCIKWNGGGSSFWVKPVELPKDKFVVAHTQ